MGTAYHPARGRRAVLAVVRVEDEEQVQRLAQYRVDLEGHLAGSEHHGQEVLGVVEIRIREDVGGADTAAVGAGGQGRHLGDEPNDLAATVRRVLDVPALWEEGGQGGYRRDQYPRGVGIVAEPLQDPLVEILVDQCCFGDLGLPALQLVTVGQLAGDQQVGHLQEAALLGQLFDWVAAVAEVALVAIQFGHRTVGARGGAKGGVAKPDTGEQAAPGPRVDATVGDRDFSRLAGPVVGDGDAFGHVDPFPGCAS